MSERRDAAGDQTLREGFKRAIISIMRDQQVDHRADELSLKLAGAIFTYKTTTYVKREGFFKPKTPKQRAVALRDFAKALERAKSAWRSLDEEALFHLSTVAKRLRISWDPMEGDFMYMMTDKAFGLEIAARATADEF